MDRPTLEFSNDELRALARLERATHHTEGKGQTPARGRSENQAADGADEIDEPAGLSPSAMNHTPEAVIRPSSPRIS